MVEVGDLNNRYLYEENLGHVSISNNHGNVA
jgi:hypothetical protein